MLSPDSRTVAMDLLRPPADYQLDMAVLTTFSLDLEALLSLPLAVMAHADGGVDELLAEPLLLMEALRRAGNRIHVFVDDWVRSDGTVILDLWNERSFVGLARRLKTRLGLTKPAQGLELKANTRTRLDPRCHAIKQLFVPRGLNSGVRRARSDRRRGAGRLSGSTLSCSAAGLRGRSRRRPFA